MLRMFAWMSRSARMVGLMVALVMATSVMGTGAAQAAGIGGGATGVLRVHAGMGTSLQGMPDVTVMLMDLSGTIVVKGQTDQTGFVTFNVLASDYTVLGSKPGYANTKVGTSVFPKETSIAMLSMTAAPDGQPTQAGAPQDGIVLGLYVNNMVSTQGIAGAGVIILDDKGALMVKGTTDAQGLYTTNLLPGMYSVIVQATGYADSKVGVDLTSSTPGATWVSVMMHTGPLPTGKH